MSEERIIVPPIKCQGIKTKLIPFIRDNIETPENGIWIEPFLGSGVVAFNVAPKRALLTDKNQYIIAFYRGIQDSSITGQTVREFLEYHSPMLEHGGAEYYHKMRDEFNKNKDPLYFLFLNRADFNGMIRFNRKGEFNVPFCQKPNRFSKAYITKICNQVNAVRKVMDGKDWTFACQPWQDSFKFASKNDCIYIDPPYIGRDTCYVESGPYQKRYCFQNTLIIHPLKFIFPCGRKTNLEKMNTCITIGLISHGMNKNIFIMWVQEKRIAIL